MTQGMEWSLIMWSVVTGILLILVFYRSTLTRQEDDQLFIDESSSSRAMEQRQLIAKVNKINPLVKLAGATSGLMMLAIAGWAVYLRLWYSLKVGGIRSPGVRDINGPTIGSSKNIL
jgi:hypothetical protein